jgi:hypothetical protein
MPEQQQRIKDVGEVFTPQNIVNDMVDLLPDLRIETIVLEPSVGEGVFLCEILRRKLKLVGADLCVCPNNGHEHTNNVGEHINNTGEHIGSPLQTLYGVDIMLDNVRKTRENLLAVITGHCGLDPQSPDNKDTITQWQKILQNNIRWGDTLACFEAKTENHNNIIYLKDLYREDLTDLQFFDYKKNKFEKYISQINEEIKQQRQEYNTRNKSKQTSFIFN